MINKTIAAISTPLGPGGIGIIRISGPDAHILLKKLFVRAKNRSAPSIAKVQDSIAVQEDFASHVVNYGYIVDPGSGNIIDEVLAIYMKGPKSFTREDVVEIQSHSGIVVLDRILSAVVDTGAELAGPGEFTKRAFLNGRIDLTQAEAVIDLINAPCETAAQMASRHITGGFREAIECLVRDVAALQARCEALIEFGEETETNGEREPCEIQTTCLQSIEPQLATLIRRQKESAIFRNGALLAIAGVPNVGKSSLLNRLVEREAAIVSEVPGTTRDVVREYISIKGVPVIVCDTAGIHETRDPVECMGIEKAREHIHQADVVLLVVEATRPLNSSEATLLEQCNNKRAIVVINKVDLASDAVITDVARKLGNLRSIKVSAKFGNGIEELKELIFNDLISGPAHTNDATVSPNLRQRKILEEARKAILSFCSSDNENSLEHTSEMLRDVLRILEGISGTRDKEDLYDNIFSQFCIGK